MRTSDWSSDLWSSDRRTGADHADFLDVAQLGVLGQAVDLCGLALGEADVALGRRLAAEHQLHELQIGCASWWERVCQYVLIPVVAVSFKKKPEFFRPYIFPILQVVSTCTYNTT